MFGLAMACKWSVVPLYVFSASLAGICFFRGRKGTQKSLLPFLSHEIGAGYLFFAMVFLPALAYFISFTPYFS